MLFSSLPTFFSHFTIFHKRMANIMHIELKKSCTYIDFPPQHKYFYVAEHMTFHEK